MLTSYPFKCHTICDARWRYIRYEDGGEELYDHNVDPYELHNLAFDKANKGVIDSLKKWLPQENTKPVGPVPDLEAWRKVRKETDMSYKVFGNITK